MSFLVDQLRNLHIARKVRKALSQSVSVQRTRHPLEAPIQVKPGRCGGHCLRRLDGDRNCCWHYQNKLCNWGKIKLHHLEEKSDPLTGEDGRTLLLEDFFKHCMILGGPGSGKTFTVLSPIVRELFRSTHMEDGPLREELKPGMLVIEAKAEFPQKIWNLAVQYGRSDDTHIFGPTHSTQINPFGDPTLTPAMLADTMATLMAALEPGRSQDDFWNKAAKLLFTNIFLMYRVIQGQPGVEPLSFDLLYRMLSDRGQSRNAEEARETLRLSDDAYKEFIRSLQESQDYFREFRGFITSLAEQTIRMGDQANAELRVCTAAYKKNKKAIPKKKKKRPLHQKDTLNQLSGVSEKILQLLTTIPDEEIADTPEESPLDVQVPPHSLSQIGEVLLTNIQIFLAEESAISLDKQVEVLNQLFTQFDRKLSALYYEAKGHLQLLASLPKNCECSPLDLIDHLGHVTPLIQRWEKTAGPINEAQRLWVARTKRKVSELYGVLKTYLNFYTEKRKAAAVEASRDYVPDSVEDYFTGTYLNIANDKTSGSIGMTASNMVGTLSQEPFNRLFSPNANFSLNEIVLDGKILVMDMNFPFYRGGAELAAILLKCEFFRFVLSKPPSRRPCFYVVDEYATIGTGGLYTGEKSFADKARGFGCGVILALQNLPMLKARFPDSEVDGLIGVMQMMVYMRNADPETNRRASVSSGEYRRAHATITATEMEYLFGKPGQKGYQIHFQDGTWMQPADFETLVPGECLFLLPPEFGTRRMRRRVRFVGDPIETIDPESLLRMP